MRWCSGPPEPLGGPSRGRLDPATPPPLSGVHRFLYLRLELRDHLLVLISFVTVCLALAFGTGLRPPRAGTRTLRRFGTTCDTVES
jgi:hypothetical protein